MTRLRGFVALVLLVGTVSPVRAQRVVRTPLATQHMPAWPASAARLPVLFHSSRPALDSTAIHPTHWLAGAIVGGVLVGLVGTGFCRLGDGEGSFGCDVATFVLFGGAIGVPVGALIGGQFPKSP